MDKKIKMKSFHFYESPRANFKDEENLRFASFWMRLGAFLIDAFLIGQISCFVFWLDLEYLLVDYINYLEKPFVDYFIVAVIFFTYQLFFITLFSSTIGKMIYGLRIISDKGREKLKTGEALSRTFSYVVSISSFLWGFFLINVDDKKHQGLHDRFAKTLVVIEYKRNLFIPALISISIVSFLGWNILFKEDKWDFFDYLGDDSYYMDLLYERTETQPENLCCNFLSRKEIPPYTTNIPVKDDLTKAKKGRGVIEDIIDAVVIVGTPKAHGTGFIISSDGLVVTNYHVIEDGDSIAVAMIKRDEKIQIFDVSNIVAHDKEKDIAILKIEGENFPFIHMGDSNDVYLGERIYTIGHPHGYRNVISEGVISTKRKWMDGFYYLHITSSIFPGNSGGPVINEEGDVIGIATFTDREFKEIVYAVPINDVKTLLRP
jgi:uncharacterized RDD family membrane protein YckC/V8-like Glu-specific endopeptidase